MNEQRTTNRVTTSLLELLIAAKNGMKNYNFPENDKKTHSLFVDNVQIGGREVNPMSKNLNEIIFSCDEQLKK